MMMKVRYNHDFKMHIPHGKHALFVVWYHENAQDDTVVIISKTTLQYIVIFEKNTLVISYVFTP